MTDAYNPFALTELRLPISQYDEVTRYTRTRADHGQPSRPDDSPFDRYLDLWFFACCVGAKEVRRIELDRDQTRRFEYGSRLQGQTERIELLELIAVASTGDPWVIGDPRAVIDVANGFAAGGLPLVFDMLGEGHSRPLANITNSLTNGLRPSPGDGPPVAVTSG